VLVDISGKWSEFFTLKLTEISFSIYEFSPYEQLPSNELTFVNRGTVVGHFTAKVIIITDKGIVGDDAAIRRRTVS
jgi:hypothetical protein